MESLKQQDSAADDQPIRPPFFPPLLCWNQLVPFLLQYPLATCQTWNNSPNQPIISKGSDGPTSIVSSTAQAMATATATTQSFSTSQPFFDSSADVPFVDRIGESARNRFGRPYISGRPLLLCDRQKIVRMHREGSRKIAIARSIGVTHSCVSKVIRRFEETGMLDSKSSRTASCACPGDAEFHVRPICTFWQFGIPPPYHICKQKEKMCKLKNLRICRHAKFKGRQVVNASQMAESFDSSSSAEKISTTEKSRKFSVEWLLSDHCPQKDNADDMKNRAFFESE